MKHQTAELNRHVRAKWGAMARIEKHRGIYRVIIGLNDIVLGEGATPEEAFEDACSR